MAWAGKRPGIYLMPAIVPMRPRRLAGSGPAAVRNERRPAPALSTGASCAQETGGGTGEGTCVQRADWVQSTPPAPPPRARVAGGR